jgi:uncharacterized RDD family membrane protein YckC
MRGETGMDMDNLIAKGEPAGTVATPPPASFSPSAVEGFGESKVSALRPIAGFPRRALAYLIDLLILQCLDLLLFLAGWLAASLALQDGSIDDLSPSFASLFVPVTLAFYFVYFTFFHAYGGQTPGKILVRIKVVGNDGGPLPLSRSFVRTLGYSLSSIFFAGFLMALFEKRGRALHDVLAGSEVVQS